MSCSFTLWLARPSRDSLARFTSQMEHPHSQDNLNFIFSSPMSSFVHPPATGFPPAQPDDPNSPILFKDNLNLVQTQISTVRSLAHEALSAMCVLSHPLPPRNSISSSSFPSADDDIVLLVRVPTSPDRHPHMRLVSTYFSSLT